MSLLAIRPETDDERPLELLYACHERVRRFTTTAGRLAGHVASHGADAEAQEAARNVLRYFDLALPNHHIDEEEDVFPALRGLADPALDKAIDELLAQHDTLGAAWRGVRPWLVSIAAGETPAQAPQELPAFVSGYAAHADFEEQKVFSAIDRLPADTVNAIAQRMRERRGA
ncbi:MAG: hemerythrin domain-containing protein [Rhodocyclaceae bacterium]|nr:hemerythrin domain-containing protein [Rhodocyclaceae bacterium]